MHARQQPGGQKNLVDIKNAGGPNDTNNYGNVSRDVPDVTAAGLLGARARCIASKLDHAAADGFEHGSITLSGAPYEQTHQAPHSALRRAPGGGALQGPVAKQ